MDVTPGCPAPEVLFFPAPHLPGPQQCCLREHLLRAGPGGKVHQALLCLLPLTLKSSLISNSSLYGIVPPAGKGLGGNWLPLFCPGDSANTWATVISTRSALLALALHLQSA